MFIELEHLETILKTGVRLVAMTQSGVRMPMKRLTLQTLCCCGRNSTLRLHAFRRLRWTWVWWSQVDVRTRGHRFLYVNEERLPMLSPSFVGWLSLEDPQLLIRWSWKANYRRPLALTANRFELGTHNTIGLAD